METSPDLAVVQPFQLQGETRHSPDAGLQRLLRYTQSRQRVKAMLSGASSRRHPHSVQPRENAAALSATRKTRQPPNRLRRVNLTLTCLLALVIAMTVTQETLHWILSPDACDVAAEDGCLVSPLVTLLVLGKQVICMVVVWSLLFRQTFAVSRYRRAVGRARQGLAPGVAVPADHWTAVASQDTFKETARTVSMAQLIVHISIGGSTCVATAAQIRNTLARLGTSDGQAAVLQACCPECRPFDAGCACDAFCYASNASMECFLTFNVGVLTCLLAPFLFIPLPVWSPVADAAFTSDRLKGNLQFTVLKRTRALPVPMAVLACVLGACIAVYVCNFLAAEMVQGVLLWRGVLVCNISVTLALLYLFVWSTGVRRLLMLPSILARTCIVALKAAIPWRSDSTARRRITHLWRCKGSWRYRQSALLMACLYTFAIEALDIRTQGANELYVGRVATFLLLLAIRDAETEPCNLEAEGAGFGLLVSASHLAAALKAHRAGRPYAGRMPRYKATVLRMQEAMAVSYRWHDEASVALGDDGLVLNITDWQVSGLLAGIQTSGCLYVWMDHLAIPEAAPGGSQTLQKTLLSRMMAVYSSAMVTLVLRSAETEGHRYHQRVWTLQEYCVAKNLIVLTEGQEGGSGEDGLAAVLGAEDRVVETLRSEHMARLAVCEPVWLSNGGASSIMRHVEKADAERIWRTYQALSAELHCRYRADTVRALYPLLWNRPAESEPELLALMRALEEVHGIRQKELESMLRESSARDFKQTVLTEYRSGRGSGAGEDSNGTSAVSLIAAHPSPLRPIVPPFPMSAWNGPRD